MSYRRFTRLLFFGFFLFQIPCFSQNVGIGTNDPTQTLDVNGKMKMRDGATNTYILQSDADGVGTWTKPTYQTRNEICVTDYGAVGDLSTDNTTAFQNAINAAAALGGIVCVPSGEYIISSTLSIPGGVILQGIGQGPDYLSFSNGLGKHGSMIVYTGVNDWTFEVRGHFSGIKDLAIYNGNVAGMKATGCIRLLADAGGFETGHNVFSKVYIWNFFEGTAFKMEASNNSEIAHVTCTDLAFRFQVTGLHIEPASGSSIHHVTFINGKIGAGSNYAFRNQGGTDISFFGSNFEGVAGCDPPTFGHIIIESGNFTGYGVRVESSNSESECSLEEETKIIAIHCYPNTSGSYYYGLTAEGRVIDQGDNEIIVPSRNIGLRSSGYNQFQNASFQRVENNAIADWNITRSGSAAGFSVAVGTPEITNRHNVLIFTVPAGESATLSPNSSVLPNTLAHQFCFLGAQIKTSVSNLAFVRMNHYSASAGTCSDLNSVFHSGDDNWQFIGMPAGLDAATCTLNPRIIFDNTGNGSAAMVKITTPSFVFGITKPNLESPPILGSGGRMNGTLSKGMATVSMPVGNEITLPCEGNLFFITGTGLIQRINNSVGLGKRFPVGTVITLIFDTASQTVQNTAFINLLGVGNYVTGVNSTLTLVSEAAGTWREIGRNK